MLYSLRIPLSKLISQTYHVSLNRLRTFLSTAMASSSNQPNTTLYINNLNDKINKEELKSQLFALFTTYGKIIDIIASKSQKMRGQAFLVFTDLAGATSAMRACEGMMFYDKPLVSNQINSRKSSYLIIYKSMSITLNQSHMLLSKEKIPTLFLQLQPMQAVL